MSFSCAARILASSPPAASEQFDKVIALDTARDEVERARALADVIRKDASTKALPPLPEPGS